MNKEYSMLFQKDGVESFSKDLQDDFDFVCTSISVGDIEGKEIETNNWLDEDGDDAYIPEQVRLKGVELHIGLVSCGVLNSRMQKLEDLTNYLCGTDGTSLGFEGLLAYSSMLNKGFYKCYFKSISDLSFYKSGTEECLECTLKLRACSFSRKVTATKNGNGTYVLEKT